MSAQSSARSKRRQSALFSSQGRPSLLPLPQLSISSITTSTPARGLKRHIPAPLPTPQHASIHLLSTPARVHDDNTTLFGFSPGAEADETALLAIDLRSAGHGHNNVQDEHLQDELFDDTAILEQRAFSNRRTSHEGDQSSGGLGALIFSNLIGNQAQDALERLELGKRRDSDTSRRSEQVGTVKRNASFTLSTGGEYLVDYETDVRFGDDLAEEESNSPLKAEAVLGHQADWPQDPPSSLFNFSSSPFQPTHTPTSLATTSNSPHRRSVDSLSENHPSEAELQRELQESLLQKNSESFPQVLVADAAYPDPRQTAEQASTPGSEATARQVHHDLTSQAHETLEVATTPVAVSPAHTSPAMPYTTRPSPALEERRQARRLRRGLTASMATLLSPVAEDRDREKSMSRSRSMLGEAIEAQQSQLLPSQQHDEERQSTPTHPEHDTEAALRNPVNSSWTIPAEPSSFNMSQPIPLASVLAASLSRDSVNSARPMQDDTIPAPSISSKTMQLSKRIEVPPMQVRTASKTHSAVSKKPSPVTSNKITSTVVPRQPVLSDGKREGPSYLKPTLSRSVQQREPVPAKREVSTSEQKAVRRDPVSRKPAIKQTSRPSIAVSLVQSSTHLPSSVRVPLAATRAPLQSSAATMVKKSAKDLPTQATRDATRASAEKLHKLANEQQVEHAQEPVDKVEAVRRGPPLSGIIPEDPKDGVDDAALTVPRGFAFAQPRKRVRQGDTAPVVASQSKARRIVRPILPVVPAARKARRVLPEENERVAGGDPEIGASVSLTEAALAAQDDLLNNAGPEIRPPLASESFDKTTHSQMLERYLRELAAIEASHNIGLEIVEQVAVQDSPRTMSAETSSTKDSGRPFAEQRAEEKEPPAKKQRTHDDPIAQSREDRAKQTSLHKSSIVESLHKPHQPRLPLQGITNGRADKAKMPNLPPAVSTVKVIQSKAQPERRTLVPKVTDFTFQVVGQQQSSFQERLAAWQAREAAAARDGRQALQPLALPSKDPAKQARKADKALSSSKRRSPVKAKEFKWHSDKRARERQDWEDRLREKEEILAELAEIRRLEAEAAEQEAIRKMRAAQVPIAHPVPAFVRSKRRV